MKSRDSARRGERSRSLRLAWLGLGSGLGLGLGSGLGLGVEVGETGLVLLRHARHHELRPERLAQLALVRVKGESEGEGEGEGEGESWQGYCGRGWHLVVHGGERVR
eukprot:scaffold91812_cov37-Phaeocystis_antarctica.AAC.1